MMTALTIFTVVLLAGIVIPSMVVLWMEMFD